MSTRAKGNRIIREKAIPHYEEQGYIVDRVESTGRFVKEKDFLVSALQDNDEKYSDKGFDIMGLAPDKIIFIQVTCNKPKTQKWYKDFAEKYGHDKLEVHVYTWYDYDGARIQMYQPDRTIIDKDLRK